MTTVTVWWTIPDPAPAAFAIRINNKLLVTVSGSTDHHKFSVPANSQVHFEIMSVTANVTSVAVAIDFTAPSE